MIAPAKPWQDHRTSSRATQDLPQGWAKRAAVSCVNLTRHKSMSLNTKLFLIAATFNWLTHKQGGQKPSE